MAENPWNIISQQSWSLYNNTTRENNSVWQQQQKQCQGIF